MNVSLVMFKADGTRRDFPVTKPRVVVGRTNHCDLRIPLSAVSRQHCEFRLDDGKLMLRDLGSSNGTYRNNTRVSSEVVLAPGDEVIVGPVVFTVVIDGKPDKIQPVKTVVNGAQAGVGGGEDVSAATGSPPAISGPGDTGVAQVTEQIPLQGNDDADLPTLEPEEEEEKKVKPRAAVTKKIDDPIAALEAMAAEDEELPILEDDPPPAPKAKPAPAPAPAPKGKPKGKG